ncbi:MAG: hypothetical protein Q8O92_11410, partial [Candidatus Latescibacter sp.]|nr:hypothetical protein [Candidatus Latescibacter sp.]
MTKAKDEKNPPEFMMRQSRLTIGIQIVSVICTLAVFIVMCLQFVALRDAQTRTLRPYISLVDGGVNFNKNNLGKENEIWNILYII